MNEENAYTKPWSQFIRNASDIESLIDIELSHLYLSPHHQFLSSCFWNWLIESDTTGFEEECLLILPQENVPRIGLKTRGSEVSFSHWLAVCKETDTYKDWAFMLTITTLCFCSRMAQETESETTVVFLFESFLLRDHLVLCTEVEGLSFFPPDSEMMLVSETCSDLVLARFWVVFLTTLLVIKLSVPSFLFSSCKSWTNQAFWRWVSLSQTCQVGMCVRCWKNARHDTHIIKNGLCILQLHSLQTKDLQLSNKLLTNSNYKIN